MSTTGGPLSRTAILARELGIPCVTAIRDAYVNLPADLHVRIDGTAGTVSLATDPAPTAADLTPPDLAGPVVVEPTRLAPAGSRDDRRDATHVLYDPGSSAGPITADLLFNDSGVTGLFLAVPDIEVRRIPAAFTSRLHLTGPNG